MHEAPGLQALFGGTFDPIHYGHLQPVSALAKLVHLQRVTLVPNNVPPHRPQPRASAQQRLMMAQLAIAATEGSLFDIDERELQRTTPSYTVTTFEALRAERGAAVPLAFIIGQDSLLTLPEWHRGLELLNYCHLLVCARPGYSRDVSAEQYPWLAPRLTRDVDALVHQPAGLIYLADTPMLAISATDIRQRLHQGRSCAGLLPPVVQRYIDEQGLYR